jgi:hypothetical protein
MDKPNFERIAQSNILDWSQFTDYIVNIPSYNYKWKLISEGKISYPENQFLMPLLEEYHLENMFPDFKYMGFMFSEWNDFYLNRTNEISEKNKFDLELFQAIKLLQHFEKGISINIIRKQKLQASIQNQDLIKIIYKGLIEYFREEHQFDYDILHSEPNKKFESVFGKDWDDYLEFLLSKVKAKTSKKGRPNHSQYIKKMINCLWKYLQEYTDFKAEEGKVYSNDQARFIYNFLHILGLIDKTNKRFNKQDIIGYYLMANKKLAIKKDLWLAGMNKFPEIEVRAGKFPE